MMLFPQALFLAKTFPKIVKNSIFLLNFYQKFSKFSQNCPTVCVFCPKARKINAWFVKSFEKYAKIINGCFAIFLINFLKISANSPTSRGLRPRTPHEVDPLKCSTRTEILAAPLNANTTDECACKGVNKNQFIYHRMWVYCY